MTSYRVTFKNKSGFTTISIPFEVSPSESCSLTERAYRELLMRTGSSTNTLDFTITNMVVLRQQVDATDCIGFKQGEIANYVEQARQKAIKKQQENEIAQKARLIIRMKEEFDQTIAGFEKLIISLKQLKRFSTKE